MSQYGTWNLAGLALVVTVAIAPEGNRVLGQQPATEVKGQLVLAEGAGISKASALKDAFRNAVIQVVGVVVDAETRVKNDQIIEDRVLTYSDGLVKRWDLVTEKVADGLTRVKIKAEVERRSVVARLRAAGVTVSDVDGGGLFAEIVTDLDAAKKSRALLEAALKDYPFGALEGKVLGKPEIVERDDTKAQIRLNLRFDVNHKVYGTVVTRLLGTLKGIARDGGTFTLTALPDSRKPGAMRSGTYWRKAMPKAFATNSGSSGQGLPLHSPRLPGGVGGLASQQHVTLAVMTNLTALQDQSGWAYFLLDESTREPLLKLATLEPRARISFLDAENRPITTDVVPLFAQQGREFMVTDRPEVQMLSVLDSSGQPQFLRPLQNAHRRQDARRCSCFVFSPIFCKRLASYAAYNTYHLLSRTVTLSLDEIRRLSTVRCEVVLDEGTGRPTGEK